MHSPPSEAPLRLLASTVALLAVVWGAATSCGGCAHVPWPEEQVVGDAQAAGALPTTLFMRPTPADSPCAATRLAVAMGVSRRGYYVLAQPAGVQQTFLLSLDCRELRDEAAVVQRPGEPLAECVAPDVLHLELEAQVTGPGPKTWGPITFTGRQRAFPGPPGEGCRYELEPEAALRKRAAEAIGWRLPPGTVGEPGTDPRILMGPANAPSPAAGPALDGVGP